MEANEDSTRLNYDEVRQFTTKVNELKFIYMNWVMNYVRKNRELIRQMPSLLDTIFIEPEDIPL